jgi:aryl-alcohol dehydrogenase
MPQITAALARSGESEFTLTPLNLDAPRADEILVRIAAVGICHTDLWMRDGLPAGTQAVLGHEGAGVVEEVGDAIRGFKPGDRVAFSFRSCGECRQCYAAHPAYCDSFFPMNFAGTRTDGSRTISRHGEIIDGNFFGQSAFADRALVYERNTFHLPSGIPFEIAAPLGCGIQTGTGAVMNALKCEEGASLLVIGGGSVGLSAVMAGAVQKCRTLIVVEPHAKRRRLALEIGATHVLDPAANSVADGVHAIVPMGVDYVIDTTGRVDLIEQGVAVLGSRGVLGLVAGNGTLKLDIQQLVMGGKSILGIIEGDSLPIDFLPHLIELYLKGRLPVDRLIKTYPFSDINQAIADQQSGKCVKPVLIF